MTNVHESDAREVVRRLEELESQFDGLMVSLERDSHKSMDRLNLTHTYAHLKQEVKSEAHRLTLLTVNRDLTEMQRDFLVPAMKHIASALRTPVSRLPSAWLPDIRDAQVEILAQLESAFPEPPLAAVERLQRELLEHCRTKARSRTKLLEAFKRANRRADAERLVSLFAELYDNKGSPLSTECVERQADIIREGAMLKRLSSAFQEAE